MFSPGSEESSAMFRLILCATLIVLLTGCAGRAARGPIVDMKGVDPAQYRIDLMECQQYADEVAVGGRAAGGAAVGAAVGGLIGAAVGDSGTAKRSAGAGAVVGGARGTGDALQERQAVVRNCLRNRGYAVLN
jgi:outer membrane lipoprotein SlyB